VVSEVPRTTRNDRAHRRQRLIELLGTGLAATQEEIVERLTSDGFRTTQATISRDLDDVGAVRRHENGRIVYALPTRNGPPTGFGKRVFAEMVSEVLPSANLVVIRTYPGMASTVAAVLDQSGVLGLLGTIAGDDTVFAVGDEMTDGKTLAKRIAALREAS
jgi:transcriptional regulator of arginine metabolism